MDKPTKSEIFGKLASLKSLYSARNIAFDQDDLYYEMQFRDKLGLPEEYKEDGIVLPTVRDIVDAGTNHISTVYARFFRPMRGTDAVAKDQAEMLRKFDMAMFYRTKIESDISPWRTAAKHGCLYGMWCFETVFDENKVPEEPEQEKGESDDEFKERMDIYNGELYDVLPIGIRSVHPRNVYPDPSGNYMIIEETKTISQARAEWSNWTAPVVGVATAGAGNYQDVVQVSYIDKKWRAIYVNNEPMLTAGDKEGIIEHDYGFVPYVVGYSGLGNQSKSSKSEIKAVGLVRYLLPLLRSESFAYSVYNIVLKSQSWPITFVSGPGAAALTTIKMKYGKIYEKPAGVTMEEYVKAPPPEFVMQHLAYTSSILAASGAPRSVRGLGETGVRSGTDRAQVISEARLRYDSIMEQLQLSTAKVMSNCTKIAERVVPEDFHIWARTPNEEFDFRVERKKIKHHYTTFVEFTPVSAEEEARRHADMENLVKTGIISSATARRRYMSHIDPEAEDIRVEAEKLRNDPAIRQVVAQLVSQELAGEMARLGKIKALQSGQLPPMQSQQPGQGIPGQPLASGEGMAQAVSAMARQNMGGFRPPMPGSPEQMAALIAGQGKPSTGGSMAVQGIPSSNPYPGAQ